jgi:hypothetical protein
MERAATILGEIIMLFRFIGPLVGAGFLLSATLAHGLTVTCAPTKMKINVTTGTVSTNSTTFRAIPGTGITFTQGGTGPSCVIVRFSAASSVTGGGISHVEAVLDQVTTAEPGMVQFSGANVGSVSHAFEFLFPSVAPGSHTLRMFFKVNSGGHTVYVDERTTTVHHAP